MKVCLISPSTVRFSGIGRLVLSVADEFKKEGHTIGIITEQGESVEHFLEIDFRSRNPITIIKNAYNAFMFIRTYDAVLCFDILPAGFLGAFVSFVLRKPFYLHCIGTYSLFSKSSRVKNMFMKLVHATSRKTFILSTAVRTYIEASLPGFRFIDPVILAPGVDIEYFTHVEEKSKYVDTPYILTVGEIKSRKGHDLSLTAFAQLSHKYPTLRYVNVGRYDRSSDFSKKLDQIITTYTISDRVLFLEGLDDEELRKLYSHAEFFIMTSRTTSDFMEGFGIVYLEAALCGRTSIGARHTGAEDAIIDAETGLLVEPDIDAIMIGMERLLSHAGERTSMAEAALKRAHSFTWNYAVKTYLSYINK